LPGWNYFACEPPIQAIAGVNLRPLATVFLVFIHDNDVLLSFGQIILHTTNCPW
jgi:hypothetical protein